MCRVKLYSAYLSIQTMTPHVRTADISVLLTVNIVSHNPAQSRSDNTCYNAAYMSQTQVQQGFAVS